jgi:hypothetical protein
MEVRECFINRMGKHDCVLKVSFHYSFILFVSGMVEMFFFYHLHVIEGFGQSRMAVKESYPL